MIMGGLRILGAARQALSANCGSSSWRNYQTYRMLSGGRFQTMSQQQRDTQDVRTGFRGCILKPMGFQRGFASSPNPGKGKGFLLTMGAALIGGGAAFTYLQTEDGRLQGLKAYTWVENLFGLAPQKTTEKKQIVNSKSEPSAVKKVEPLISKALSAKAEASPPPQNNNNTEAHCEDCVEKKCGDSDCLRKMDREEELIAKANSELEKALKDVKPKAVEYTEAALKAYCEATELVKLFMDKVYCAIEEDNLESPRFEEVWCDVYDTALKRCEKVKDALSKGQCAWELLCRLREVIENGKACKYTSCNPLLITAEEALTCAERELLSAKAKMENVQSESRMVEQYRNVIEDFRRDLKAEVDTLLTSDDCKATFTGNECTMVLTHAYKKVLRIQKELAQVQMLAVINLDEEDSNAKMSVQLREDYEREIIDALKRQAIAYQENFDNQLNVIKQEYERKLTQQESINEAERVVELRAKYGQASAALAAIEQGIDARQEMNAKSQKLRKLWSTCNSLFSEINYAQYYQKDTTSTVNKSTLVVEFEGDPFASQLIQSLPDKVTSFEGLKSRFFEKLEPTCRKTTIAKSGESFSLFKYALGTLQASLVAKCDGERSTASTTYEILDRTGFHLKRGDLLEATVTLNQLQGLPREIASDWLKDSRAVLESNQTLFTLMTYAASNNVY